MICTSRLPQKLAVHDRHRIAKHLTRRTRQSNTTRASISFDHVNVHRHMLADVHRLADIDYELFAHSSSSTSSTINTFVVRQLDTLRQQHLP